MPWPRTARLSLLLLPCAELSYQLGSITLRLAAVNAESVIKDATTDTEHRRNVNNNVGVPHQSSTNQKKAKKVMKKTVSASSQQ